MYEDPPIKEYTYSNTMYSLVVLLFVVMLVGFSYLAYASEDGEEMQGVIMIQLVIFIPLIILFLPSFNSRHVLYSDRLVVTQGLLFKGTIPFSNIASYQATEERVAGLGVKFNFRMNTIYVTTHWKKLVALEFREQMGFGRSGFGKKVNRLVFNLDDPEDLIFQLDIHLSKYRREHGVL